MARLVSGMPATSAALSPASPVVRALMPIMATVLVGFLVIGAAMPVLPLHVRDSLGFGPTMVGIVAGCQFAASLLARFWSGRAADARGAKWAVVAGLLAATVAGLLYLLSLGFVDRPGLSVTILLCGRAVLGGAESFIITGATTWGLLRVGLSWSRQKKTPVAEGCGGLGMRAGAAPADGTLG